jgi:diguanylate cyclase (GGDEF)-like protein
MDATTLAHDVERRDRLVVGLLGLVDEACRHGRSWTASAAFDRAVTRWSREAQSPLDVLVLVAEVRRSRRSPSKVREAVLEHLSLVAVAAVSERMVSEALTDPLTGLATRARLDEEVQHLLAASLRSGTPLTAVVMDVDGLKHLNDTQGHAAGDAALAELGRAIRVTMRKVDRGFRIGGDEFALILPDTTAEAARSVVERIQQHCATPFSVGVATHSGDHWDTDLASWLQEADEAMYQQRQQLRSLCTPALPVRSGKARVVGVFLAAGVSIGAWGGIAVAVHGVMDNGTPTRPSGTSTGTPTTPHTGGSGTVALPRGVNPQVVTVSRVTPARSTVEPVARPAAPAVTPPVVKVPTVQVPPVTVPPVEVPDLEPPAPVSPPSASQTVLGTVFRTVGGLLKSVLS